MSLLFITATRIGDAVLSTGVLDHLIRATPGVRVSVACGPLAADLFAAVPGREETFVLTKGPRARHWRQLWRACVGRHWETVVDLRASPVSWVLRTNRRYWLRPGPAHEHKVVRLARLLGISPPPAPRLWLAPEHHAVGDRLIPLGAPVLAVAPVANWHGKTWPIQRFVEITRRLTAADGPLPGGRVAVLGGAEDRAAAQPLLDAVPAERRLDLLGQGSLLEVQAALERCAFFLGNDSGLMHMAAAAGIPTLGLFGPTPDAVYGPWGRCTAVVRTPEPPTVLFPPGTNAATVGPLMQSLRLETVEAAAWALWERRPRG